MEKNKFLSELAELSVEIGREVAYVQGGGGNTSVKLSSREMAIKASGTNLKDMTAKEGFSVVDYSGLSSFLETLGTEEINFSDKVRSFRTATNNRPSIETGFHSFLGKYVIHTHSAYVNVLTCASRGNEALLELFPEAIWIDYATPGRDLTLEIRQNINFPISSKGIIFLQNHGLIVWDEDCHEALRVHKGISKTIIDKFNLPVLNFNDSALYNLSADPSKILFPDQVVFTLADDEILNSKSAQETICSHNYILDAIDLIGLAPIFLPGHEASKLLNMESEKFRQNLIKK